MPLVELPLELKFAVMPGCWRGPVPERCRRVAMAAVCCPIVGLRLNASAHCWPILAGDGWALVRACPGKAS